MITLDLSALSRNVTYGQHYQLAVYLDCKPCPTRYQCEWEVDPPTCSTPRFVDNVTVSTNLPAEFAQEDTSATQAAFVLVDQLCLACMTRLSTILLAMVFQHGPPDGGVREVPPDVRVDDLLRQQRHDGGVRQRGVDRLVPDARLVRESFNG